MGTIKNKTKIITSVRYDKIHLWGSTWTPVSIMRIKAVLLLPDFLVIGSVLETIGLNSRFTVHGQSC